MVSSTPNRQETSSPGLLPRRSGPGAMRHRRPRHRCGGDLTDTTFTGDATLRLAGIEAAFTNLPPGPDSDHDGGVPLDRPGIVTGVQAPTLPGMIEK